MMRRTFLLAAAVLTALALVAPATAAGAAVNPPTGLWASDYPAPTTINDNGTVELGVKFITSAPLVVEGVRIYRVDAGDVTGTLWTASGTQLATGQFSPYAGPGWQDLIFTQPVQITPGTTYIASYLAPNADYAYEHYFFTTSALTVGPITAKQSIAAEGNGVYCYVGQPPSECVFPFPESTYRDSNYWVTPLWNEPPTADAGGSYYVDEGGSVLVSASGSDPENGPLTYAWDLDNDGSFETPGQSVTFSAAGLDGPNSYTIKVQATDDVGQSAIASATVNVINVAPTVSTPTVTPEPSIQDSSATASATFSDPGPDAPFTCTVNYGDGSGDLPGTVSVSTCTGPSHSYSTIGAYTVTINVTDKDGSTGSNSTTHAVVFDFSGFFQPVDNVPSWNKAKAGSAIPVKFSLGGDFGLNILKVGYPQATLTTCPGGPAITDAIEETVTAGGSSLSYDPYTNEYVYVWKTNKAWAGRCYQFELGLNDGTSHTFNVQFVK